MRKKKHGEQRLAACSKIALEFDREKGLIGAESFLNGKTVYLEIGCGKGDFVCGMAQRYPETAFIAVERVSDVMVTAMEKAMSAGIENIRFVIADAAALCDALGENSIDRLYLNFSDPWPKKGYAKRRLTHRKYLEKYKRILKDGTGVYLKTDNRQLFDFSLEEFQASGYRVEAVTGDLHNSEYAKDNIMTEYEKNFTEKGIPINRCEAYVNKAADQIDRMNNK